MESGGTPKSSNKTYYDGNIPFLSISDISGNKLYKTKKFISEIGLNNSSTKIIKENNIIYTMYATPGIAFLNNIDVAIPQSVISIELKDNFNKLFVLNLLNFYRNNILSLAMTGTQSNLTGEIVKNIKVKIPSLEEQNKIANLLSSIDILIEKQEAYITKLMKRKKFFLKEIFKQSLRFKGFEEKWQNNSISNISIHYKGLTGKSKEEFSKNLNSRYIQFKNIHSKIIESELGYVYIASEEKQNKVLENDILLTGTSENVKEIAISNINKLKSEVYLNSFSYGLRFNTLKINPTFFLYLSKTPKIRKELEKESQGITRINISINKISEISISYPSLEEQKNIVNLLSSMDNFIKIYYLYHKKYMKHYKYFIFIKKLIKLSLFIFKILL